MDLQRNSDQRLGAPENTEASNMPRRSPVSGLRGKFSGALRNVAFTGALLPVAVGLPACDRDNIEDGFTSAAEAVGSVFDNNDRLGVDRTHRAALAIQDITGRLGRPVRTPDPNDPNRPSETTEQRLVNSIRLLLAEDSIDSFSEFSSYVPNNFLDDVETLTDQYQSEFALSRREADYFRHMVNLLLTGARSGRINGVEDTDRLQDAVTEIDNIENNYQGNLSQDRKDAFARIRSWLATGNEDYIAQYRDTEPNSVSLANYTKAQQVILSILGNQDADMAAILAELLDEIDSGNHQR